MFVSCAPARASESTHTPHAPDRSKVPDFPPALYSIWTFSILASFVTAFTMSMTVSPATAAPAAAERRVATLVVIPSPGSPSHSPPAACAVRSRVGKERCRTRQRLHLDPRLPDRLGLSQDIHRVSGRLVEGDIHLYRAELKCEGRGCINESVLHTQAGESSRDGNTKRQQPHLRPSGWHSGMSCDVSFVPCIPAICATESTSPCGGGSKAEITAIRVATHQCVSLPLTASGWERWPQHLFQQVCGDEAVRLFPYVYSGGGACYSLCEKFGGGRWAEEATVRVPAQAQSRG